tara:strand:+ start:4270 stop:4647 length:378 start_codon:yes stop_codon:yes gene_type:complete
MKKLLFIFLIFFSNSCKEKEELIGDWKLVEFMRDNEIQNELPNFPITYFKKDNFVIYFEKLMSYKIEGDSIIFSQATENKNEIFRMKIEITDENNFTFYYKRQVTNNLNDSTYLIPLYSKWKRIE